MKSWEQYVEEAEGELKEKSYDDVQEDTAFKWGARSYIAYLSALNSEDRVDMVSWFLIATEYEHEASEHASLIKDKDRSDDVVEKLALGLSEISDMAFSLCAGEELNEDEDAGDKKLEEEVANNEDDIIENAEEKIKN